MKIKLLIVAALTFSFLACQNSATTSDQHEEHVHHDHDGHDHEGHDHEGHDHAAHDGKHFGAPVSVNGAISHSKFMEQMEGKDSLVTKIAGTVEDVCQMKGCWMNITSEHSEGTSTFVSFKDYAFFMPLDCTGKKVVMEGKGYYEETSVEDLKHYAQDGGKSQEEIDAITSPVRELKFEATGVVFID